MNERLPTTFYPVSPPPYLNGGPTDYLSWVVESTDKDFSADALVEWLEGRMPSPVDDLTQWEDRLWWHEVSYILNKKLHC